MSKKAISLLPSGCCEKHSAILRRTRDLSKRFRSAAIGLSTRSKKLRLNWKTNPLTLPENQLKKIDRKPLFGSLLRTVLVVGAVALAVAFRGSAASELSILKLPFASEKLSTNGKVLQAVISPDGRNVIYASGSRGEKQSVWIRQRKTGNNVEIIPPSDNVYLGFAVSQNGIFVYFSRVAKNAENQAEIYRVSIFGGIPQKIIGETQGWISVSPDGKEDLLCPLLLSR